MFLSVSVHIEHIASFITCSLSHNFLVMTSIAQLIKASEYVCTGRYPVQASAVFLNELIISLSFYSSLSNFRSLSPEVPRMLPTLVCTLHKLFNSTEENSTNPLFGGVSSLYWNNLNDIVTDTGFC